MNNTRKIISQFYWFLWRCVIRLTKDPTLLPPPSYNYSLFHAKKVYGDAFFRCFEFLKQNHIRGDVAEFGTFNGFTSKIIAKSIKKFRLGSSLHLFDSFQGLPDISSKADLNCYEVKDLAVWCKTSMTAVPNAEKGIFKTLSAILPSDRLNIHKGFYSDTLHKTQFKNKLALVHVDCDLYQSAYEVLNQLVQSKALMDGTILVFDDYNSSRGNPNFGERKAIAEVFDGNVDYSLSLFFTYGWHGAAFIVHDKAVS
jgi:hypothetical protein